jgi:hypothetical protein
MENKEEVTNNMHIKSTAPSKVITLIFVVSSFSIAFAQESPLIEAVYQSSQ